MITKKSLNSVREKFHIQREIDIQSKLRHAHIISVYEVYESESTVTLVMEYASGGELFDYINSQQETSDGNPAGLDEAECRHLFRQLVSAVQYLHENGIVHRDLKLENILLDGRGNAKLADFGLSTTFGHGHLLKTYCGSPLYASPEIVNARPYIGPEVDCWSLGVLLYAMLYGTMPFDGHDFRSLRQQISNGLIQQPTILSGAHDLILHILEPSLQERATLHDIATHCWLQDGQHQDSTDLSPCTTPRPEPTDNDLDVIPSDSDVGPTRDTNNEYLNHHCLPESDSTRRMPVDHRRRSAPAPFYDSLFLQESDGRSRSVSSCRSPNLVLVEDGECSPQNKMITGDYVPLCDGLGQLSVDIASSEYSHHTSGSFSDDHSPQTLSDLCFQSISRHRRLSSANSDSLSDAGRSVMSDAPSRGVLATASETAKLPITFSADSLELMAGEDHTDGNESTNLFIGNCGTADVNNLVDADDSEAENEDCHSVHYDFADIDAVLNHIPTGSGIGIAGAIDVDVASQVSDDSLEDAV